MHTRALHPPVHRRHVRIMLVVLALGTLMLITPIGSLDALAFWNSIEPAAVGTLVAATFFLPAARLQCTRRGSWSALRRAQRGLRNFGLNGVLLCVVAMVSMVATSRSVTIANTVFDVCFDGMIDGATLYLWSLAALPVLRGLVWAESARKQRGAR